MGISCASETTIIAHDPRNMTKHIKTASSITLCFQAEIHDHGKVGKLSYAHTLERSLSAPLSVLHEDIVERLIRAVGFPSIHKCIRKMNAKTLKQINDVLNTHLFNRTPFGIFSSRKFVDVVMAKSVWAIAIFQWRQPNADIANETTTESNKFSADFP